MNKQELQQFKQNIFTVSSDDEFTALSIRAFHYQYENVPVYRSFCDHLGIKNPVSLEEIPFLPISFFKSHKVIVQGDMEQKVFKSSGTSGLSRSDHFIVDLELYEKSFYKCYEAFFGNPEEQIIIGLLPSYLEQGDSSLVYMVEHLINKSNHRESGFYLNNYEDLINSVKRLQNSEIEVVLFGVSYALLDLADFCPDFSNVKVVETGGMKGKRKELLKEELHDLLKNKLNLNAVYSEYGMTELLSQAYMMNNKHFSTPTWMKILVRDINDPLSILPVGKSGGINVIDLANIHSCCFIATEDLGKLEDNQFKILGRLDLSDIRGCNLLVN